MYYLNLLRYTNIMGILTLVRLMCFISCNSLIYCESEKRKWCFTQFLNHKKVSVSCIMIRYMLCFLNINASLTLARLLATILSWQVVPFLGHELGGYRIVHD